MRRPGRATLAGWAGLAAMLGGWLLSTPLGAGPDEAAQYDKAIATAHGEWTGRPGPVAMPASETTPAQLVLYRSQNRDFRVPRGAALPDRLPCFAFRMADSARCDRLPLAS